MARGREKSSGGTVLPRATARRPRGTITFKGEVVPHPSAVEPIEPPVPSTASNLNIQVENELDAAEGRDQQELRGDPEDGLCIDPNTTRPTVLSTDDMLFIWRLHQKGLSTRAISRLLSTRSKQVSPATINRFIRRVNDRPEDIQLALKGLRREAVDTWREAMHKAAKDGRHNASKDLLVATGAIRNDAPLDRVIIVVGDGRAAVAQLPAAPDVLPGEVIEAEKTSE